MSPPTIVPAMRAYHLALMSTCCTITLRKSAGATPASTWALEAAASGIGMPANLVRLRHEVLTDEAPDIVSDRLGEAYDLLAMRVVA